MLTQNEMNNLLSHKPSGEAFRIATCLTGQMPLAQAVGYLEQVVADNPKAKHFREALDIVKHQQKAIDNAKS